MKDFLTPVGTPFSLANGPSTPNRQGLSHYFAETHRHPAPTASLSPHGDFSTRSGSLLLSKLQLASCRSQDGPREPQSLLEALPNEILSLILEHGYFNSGRAPPNTSFRHLALAITPHLRDIALQTPSLWSVIHLSPSNLSDNVDRLPLYLHRSKAYPLNVHLDCFWCSDVTDTILEHLTAHSTHLGQLAITTSNDHVLQTLQTLNAPFLTALSLTFYSNQRRIALPSPVFRDALPRLTYLRLRNVDFDTIGFSLRNLQTLEVRGHGTWPAFTRLAEMLGDSTSLQRLILHVKPELVLNQVLDSQPGSAGTAGTPNNCIRLPGLLHMEIFTSEWLTEDVSELVRLFDCPNLQAFVMREGISAATETPNTVMAYSQPPNGRIGTPSTCQSLTEPWDQDTGRSTLFSGLPNRMLWVNRANIHHACSALANCVAPLLTTLELHRAFFPSLVQAREIFGSLKSLSHLVILEFSATELLSQMMEFVNLDQIDWNLSAGAIEIPPLKQLFIDFRNNSSLQDLGCWLKEFIRLFHIPGLSSLVLKGMTASQWCEINEAFQDVEKYPLLTSLKVISMQDALPSGIESPVNLHPTRAFPKLESLSLHNFSTNDIIRPLAFGHQDRPTIDGFQIWPNLTSLTISDDPLSSKPLLHKAISMRSETGRPLQKLFLDEGFSRNQESLEWLQERVGLLRIFRSGLVRPLENYNEDV